MGSTFGTLGHVLAEVFPQWATNSKFFQRYVGRCKCLDQGKQFPHPHTFRETTSSPHDSLDIYPQTGQKFFPEFPGISQNFPEFPGISRKGARRPPKSISRNFPEFPGISRNFPEFSGLRVGVFTWKKNCNKTTSLVGRTQFDAYSFLVLICCVISCLLAV